MATAAQKPTNARATFLAFIYTLAVVTYLDRVCISSAIPYISQEFGLSDIQKGYVFSAFTLAYAAFEIPSGWLGDRFGARLALTRIVLWWSALTALTGATIGFWSLIIIRFLFGMGEAGAFPNIARSVSQWLPRAESGRGMSTSFVGLATGAGLSAPIVITLIDRFGWRWAFVIFGLAGVVWALAWQRWFRDDPAQHPAVNAAELALIREDEAPANNHHQPIPWRRLFSNRNLWTICLMYFCYAYSLYFYLTWLPTYLIEGRGFEKQYAKWYAALPWLLSAVTFRLGGWLTDRLARTHGLKIARCGVGACGYGLSALTLLFVPLVANRVGAAVLLAFALCFQSLTISAAWAVCLDVGRRNAGVVTGFMNTFGNVGGTLAPVIVGYTVQRLHSWSLPFYWMALVFTFGVVMWLLVDPHAKLDEA